MTVGGSAVWLTVVVIATTGCRGADENAAPGPADDSPSLVFGRSVGDVRVGMKRVAVERRYGKPAREKALRGFIFPVGTRYHGKSLVRTLYRVHGGILEVEYVDGDVKTVRTTSSYYRTADGVGPGAQLPRDRCRRLDDTGRVGPAGCKDTWHGLSFDADCLDAWLTSQRGRTMTLLYMHRGRRIESVRIGDPDVILPCF